MFKVWSPKPFPKVPPGPTRGAPSSRQLAPPPSRAHVPQPHVPNRKLHATNFKRTFSN